MMIHGGLDELTAVLARLYSLSLVILLSWGIGPPPKEDGPEIIATGRCQQNANISIISQTDRDCQPRSAARMALEAPRARIALLCQVILTTMKC